MRAAVRSILLAALAAGCLPGEREVAGRRLVAGRQIEKPAFVRVDREDWVLFDVRRAPAISPRAGVSDLAMVSWATGELRQLAGGRSDAWDPVVDDAGVRYVMVDERSVVTASGASTQVATLVRLRLAGGEIERIPGVQGFSVAGRRFVYRTMADGARYPDLHLRDQDGTDRALGSLSGSVDLRASSASWRLYFVSGEERALVRATRERTSLEMLRQRVGRFQASGDERYAVVSVSEPGRTETLVLDLVPGADGKREEIPLPTQNPCCWMQLAGDTFEYSESGSATAGPRLHRFNVVTRREQVFAFPVGMDNVLSFLPRPGTTSQLAFDGRGRVAVFDEGADPPGRLLDFRPNSGQFSDDGKYFVYIDPEVAMPQPEGRLLVRDAEFRSPPRAISPLGSLVPQSGYFFFHGHGEPVLAFWSHFGRSAADLYFANYQDFAGDRGRLELVARGISEVTVTPSGLVGIVNVSQQDLVGDFVVRELVRDGDGKIAYHDVEIAHRVADATILDRRAAFVVRDRIPSPVDGLWAVELPGPGAAP